MISGSAINSISFLSQYCIKSFPNLKYFNQKEISPKDKISANQIIDYFIKQTQIIKFNNKLSINNKAYSRTRIIAPNVNVSSRNIKIFQQGNEQNFNLIHEYVSDLIQSSIRTHSILNSYDSVL